MTAEKRQQLWVGFSLITMGWLYPAVMSIIDFLLSKAKIELIKAESAQLGLKTSWGDIGIGAALVVAGILYIMQDAIAKWISAWRCKKK